MGRRLPFSLSAVAAATLALVAATPGAAARDDTQTLLRLASGITRLKIQQPLDVASPTARAARTRRASLHRVLYPAASRGHDAALFHLLGLAPSAATARRALEPAPSAAPFFDPRRGQLVLPRGTVSSRATLMREVVTALQDQHFQLGRALRRVGDRDALAAARAASEGYSRLVAQLVAPTTARDASAPPLRRFLELREGFHATRAVRFAAELRNLGSNRAVWTALKAFPTSTEQVFHLEKFLQRERPLPVALPTEAAGLRLASTETFGELDVRALLAAVGVPGLDRAATGWGGGRSAVYRDEAGAASAALVLRWDTSADAVQWSAAVADWVSRSFADVAPGVCATTCWVARDRVVAFARSGARTALAVAVGEETASALADALTTGATSSST